MKIIIKKYEPYPEAASTGRAVGYQVTSETGRIFYIDTVIEASETIITDDHFLTEAWNVLKDEITLKAEELDKKATIVGSTWSPVSEEIVEETPETPAILKEDETEVI